MNGVPDLNLAINYQNLRFLIGSYFTPDFRIYRGPYKNVSFVTG